jgi:large subunit ribosomal protein L21
MFAIIEESGGQRKVEADETILIDLYQGGEGKPGDAITFDKVLVVGDEGGKANIGKPYVEGASVSGEIVEPLVKGEKLFIQKFRPKKGYKRRTGHRQKYTAVKVTGIKG